MNNKIFKFTDVSLFPKEKGVYKVYFTDCKSNKFYIGSASGENGFYNRWKSHISDLTYNKSGCVALQRAYNKHFNGDNLTFEILEICEKSDCLIMEQHYIDLFNTYKKGYNSRPKASNNGGLKMSLSAKKSIYDKWKLKRDIQSSEVKKLYESGKTTREIGDLLGVSRTFLKRIFDENNIIPRKERGCKKIKIYQYKDNVIINEFESINDCGRKLNFNTHGIDLVLKGKCSHYKGYYFSDKELKPEEVEKIITDFKKRSKNIKYKNINQFTKDGVLVKKWENVNEILKYFDIKNRTNLYKAINNDRLYNGYYWN
jgi:group I intron endonuclease